MDRKCMDYKVNLLEWLAIDRGWLVPWWWLSAHWRGWEPGSCSVHETGCLAGPIWRLPPEGGGGSSSSSSSSSGSSKKNKRHTQQQTSSMAFSLNLLIYFGHPSRGYPLWEESSQLTLLGNVLTDLSRGFSLSDASSCHTGTQDEPSEISEYI